MDNFEYVDMDKIQLKTGEGDEKPDEKVLDIRRTLWIKSDWYPLIRESMCQV